MWNISCQNYKLLELITSPFIFTEKIKIITAFAEVAIFPHALCKSIFYELFITMSEYLIDK